ncbi:hypothetical protein MZO42_07960 [Sphingomonas psychrotolerans]|uniref:Conjugal transfer protein TrbI n=1 Tax=Sphingomonas psychrotolerans TaxID=1327635 RepID=A0ABU3N243_9SPHN|nr:hypothetical protein [Sphingomonas psychrotolerans]MDT8758629.1 hypothetical protein [Sphingomonas psychrotolerans]
MARSTSKSKTSANNSKTAAAKGASKRALALGTLSIGAVVGAVAAAAFALLKGGKHTYVAGEPLPGASLTPADAPAAAKTRSTPGSAEHVPTDLMGDEHPGPEDRAVEAFRPDPTAPIPDGERDAFRPALAGASAPTLVKGEARENERLDATPS